MRNSGRKRMKKKEKKKRKEKGRQPVRVENSDTIRKPRRTQ